MNNALAQTIRISPFGLIPPIPELESWWVLLWSQSQCAVHIESVQDMLKSNRRAYTEDRRKDFVPVFFGQREACDSISLAIRGTMRERQEQRPQGRIQ